MNPAARQHLRRAELEIRALRVEVESLTWPAPGSARSWQLWSWLEARALARGRAASAVTRWVKGVPPSRSLQGLELFPDEVARSLLAGVEIALVPLGSLVGHAPDLSAPGATDALMDHLHAVFVEGRFTEDLQRLEQITDLDRDEPEALEDALRTRASLRGICAELTDVAGAAVATGLADRWRAELARLDLDLASVDRTLRRVVPAHPTLGPFATWLRSEVYTPPRPDRLLMRLDQGLQQALADGARRLVERLGLTGVLDGDGLPWIGDGPPGWL